MLTGRLVRVRHYRDRLAPSYVDAKAPEWLEAAERLLSLFRGKEGTTRGELEDDVKETFGNDPQTLLQQGLAKLLEDRCEFEVVSGRPPEELRELVFAAAAAARQQAPAAARPAGAEASKPRCTARGPDSGRGVEDPAAANPAILPARTPAFARAGLLKEVAQRLQLDPAEVERGLFADLKSEQQLVKFNDISAERLLERYNLALAQALLLRSTGVTVTIRNEPPRRYRHLLRSIKFHRLIADLERIGPEAHRLRLDGPLSLFSATQKYGLQLALFLPALLLCKNFELMAELRWGAERKEKHFTLTPKDGLVAHLPDTGSFVPPELALFVQLFKKKIAGWEISEEADVLPLGDGFWVPDFRLVEKATGKTVYLEVLGFWRRSSVEKHLGRLRQHAQAPFVLAISEQLKIDEQELAALPAGVHRFRQMPLPEEVVRLAASV